MSFEQMQHRSQGDSGLEPSSQQASSQGPRKGPRIRLSCLRCQRRKIRCDGALPSCGSCARAGVHCVDGDHLRGRDLPRAYITSLKNRIAWLEAALKIHRPDIDLSAAPKIVGGHESSRGSESESNLYASNQDDEATAPQDLSQKSMESNAIESPGTTTSAEGLAHQIGLVSLSNGADPKYIGPSSGFFFAQLMLASIQQTSGDLSSESSPSAGQNAGGFDISTLISNAPAQLPSNRSLFIQLTSAYFDCVHIQWPFIHRPSLLNMYERVSSDEDADHPATFQVYMVLAVSSMILSRRARVALPTGGYFANAMRHFDRIRIETSISGLQCLLLLQVYALFNPSTYLNSWYLNYQCIAAVVDLGLQRDIRPSKTMSPLDSQMRRRIFWSVYSFDRSLGTMMGRPIGLRDEAYDVKLPDDLDDDDISDSGVVPRDNQTGSGHMRTANHLFRLSLLNSEMKYVLHSVSRIPVPHANPNIPNLDVWQSAMLQRLGKWRRDIPASRNPASRTLCEIQYHAMVQMLLRPTPAIPSPKAANLRTCHESAVSAIRLLNFLYKDELIVYQSSVLHSLILSTVTMFYCIWNVSGIASEVKVDVFMSDCRAASNMLAAAGEHWPGAKRSSGFLDELGGVIIRRIVEAKTARSATAVQDQSTIQGPSPSESTISGENFQTVMQQQPYPPSSSGYSGQQMGFPEAATYQGGEQLPQGSLPFDLDNTGAGAFGNLIPNDFNSLFDVPGIPNNNFDNLMQGMFDDWFPMTIDQSFGEQQLY